MKATQQFIEDAIAGGWRVFAPSDKPIEVAETGTWPIIHGTAPSGVLKLWPLASCLLDPLAWQAVGKTRGWPENEIYLCPDCETIGVGTGNHMQACKIKDRMYPWRTYLHRFSDALCDGKDIEASLSSIE